MSQDVSGLASYLQPEDDGLLMRDSGQWTNVKLYYLQRYIEMFITRMRKQKWRALNYIDLLAGPGKCFIRENKQIVLGSPLIALKAPHAFDGYYFVDLDSENVKSLQTRCAASSHFGRIRFYTGDCNHLVGYIVSDINATDSRWMPDRWPSLNLAFLDPEGLELHWRTVEELAKVNRMDLIIYYPLRGLRGAMKQSLGKADGTAVDLFFGDTKWRDIHRDWERRPTTKLHRLLMDHYQKKLQALGYRLKYRAIHRVVEPLVRSTRKRAPLYHIMFASKDELGYRFWSEAIQHDVYGQQRMDF